jgi:hypothetical protein
MKSLLLFYLEVLNELGTQHPASTARDAKTITSRFEHEGLSFLTITLTTFGKDFEKSLDLEYVAHDRFMGFARYGGLPRLFGGFLERVFDRSTGRLLDNPDLAAIRAVRQLTLMFGKIGVQCSDERVQKAKDKYIQCEQDVRSSDRNASPSDKLDYMRVAASLWTDALSVLENDLYQELNFPGSSGLRPKHGRGSTADGLTGNKKYRQNEWTARLHDVFPYWDYVYASHYQLLNEGVDSDPLNILEPGAERPVKVITVPKTLKTPRIIAMEPTCMQYMQQMLHERLQEIFRVVDTPRNLICYDSQTPNQELARIGSLDGSLATLDLSEASDRVSYQHVRWLLADFPHVMRAVDATRSRKADIDGKVVRLAKFASMGSALCFPMEAMVFATVVFLGIERALNRQLTKGDITSLFGKVRVYGDDIVVPTEYAGSVQATLQAFGFKVNADKSFWNGQFRESCGREYFRGHDVSITRVRTLFPTGRSDAGEIASTVSLRNHLYQRGLWNSASWLDKKIRKLIPFPKVKEGSAILGRLTNDDDLTVGRRCSKTQRSLVRGAKVKAHEPLSLIDGYDALLKFYLKRGDKPFDVEHWLRTGRPQRVSVEYVWAPVR